MLTPSLPRAGVRKSIKVVALIESEISPYSIDENRAVSYLKSTPVTSVLSSLKYVVVTPIKSPLEFLVMLGPYGSVFNKT